MNNEIYSTPSANVITETSPSKASPLLKITSFGLALLLMLCSGLQQFIATGGRLPETIGGAVGGIIWPLLVVALFQIGKGFRNEKSRYKIFMWTALVFFLIIIVGFAGQLLVLAAA